MFCNVECKKSEWRQKVITRKGLKLLLQIYFSICAGRYCIVIENFLFEIQAFNGLIKVIGKQKVFNGWFIDHVERRFGKYLYQQKEEKVKR